MINGYSIGDFSRTVAYEPTRNLVSVVSNSYSNVSLSRFAYTNDAAGRRTNREDSGSAFASTQANSFGYNTRNEVTSAEMRNGNSTYNFDQIGNRITVSTPDEPDPLVYTTNALNQYTAISGPAAPPPPRTPLHDPDGNLTNDGKGTTFEWNAENRMVRITTPTKVIENTFDAQGRRVRKQVFTSDLSTLTSDIRYFYDGWNVIYEDDILSSADTKYYVWGLDLSQSLQGAGGVGGLLLVKQGTNTWAPTYDANGNISEYIDLSDGSVTAHLEYDAFGRKIVSTGTAPSTFGFSTKYEDVETGYLYYGYRFYDPVTGRWPNRDPIEEQGGYNLYGFIWNDCINQWDYLGNHPAVWFVANVVFSAAQEVFFERLSNYMAEKITGGLVLSACRMRLAENEDRHCWYRNDVSSTMDISFSTDDRLTWAKALGEAFVSEAALLGLRKFIRVKILKGKGGVPDGLPLKAEEIWRALQDPRSIFPDQLLNTPSVRNLLQNVGQKTAVSLTEAALSTAFLQGMSELLQKTGVFSIDGYQLDIKNNGSAGFLVGKACDERIWLV